MDIKKDNMTQKDKLYIVREIGTFDSLNVEDPTLVAVEPEVDDEELIKKAIKENLTRLTENG